MLLLLFLLFVHLQQIIPLLAEPFVRNEMLEQLVLVELLACNVNCLQLVHQYELELSFL